MKDSRWWRLLPIVVTLLIAVALDPRAIFMATTPSGPDLGAHVFPFSIGVTSLLESGRLLGWSSGWFAGFPIFYFYFPLPAILAAALTPVFGFPIALKLVTVSGPLLLPVAAYVLARPLGFSRFESGVASFIGSLFVFMESYWHLGGNLYSTLLGEFAFGLSFSLSILFVGLVVGWLRTPTRRIGLPALLLALTAMSHVLTTIAVVIATLPNLLLRDRRTWTVGVWVLGFAIAGFWAIPFLIRSSHMGHLPWIPGRSILDLLPVELWLVLPPAAAGLRILARRSRTAMPLLALVTASVILFVLPTGLEMRDRLLPYWFFGAYFAAGVALGSWIQRYVDDRRTRPLLASLGTIGLLVTLFLVRTPDTVVDFARTNLAGYESRAEWPEYDQFLSAVRALAPGRVIAQSDTTVERWGSAHAATVLPYWAPQHPSLTGFWGESSPTAMFAMRTAAALSPERRPISFRGGPQTPYAPEVGTAQAAYLGARYFAAFSEAGADGAAEVGLQPLVEGDGFTIFEIDGRPLVSPASHTPTVAGGPDFLNLSLAWFQRHDRLDEWLVASGPAEWPRLDDDPAEWPRAETVTTTTPVDVLVDDDGRLTFETTAIGVPHLVRISYFPNWRVTGARGPYLAAPYFMVVIPTQSRVTLEFRDTWVEWLGRMVTAMGLATLVGIAVLQRRRTAIPMGTTAE